MTNDAVAASVGDPNSHRLALARRADPNNDDGTSRPTQIDVMRLVQEVVDFDKPEEFPDDTYAHAVLMAAAALDPVLQGVLANVVAKHNRSWPGGGTAKLSAAAIKAFA